ncbi:MAG: hypothetical protein LQ340_005205 [Diploschistes diacapsis]|nr:MAG: hypothetical protein LQ340_005205 [Diploschistes diacapsis]
MSTSFSTPHPERTATQPRQSSLHNATIAYIKPANSRIRLIRLALPYAISFLPGQWIDLHIPSLPRHTGGFTITSSPSLASPGFISTSPKSPASTTNSTPSRSSPHPSQHPSPKPPYLELAIQSSPSNPPAAWLWKPESEILGEAVKKSSLPETIRLLYSTRLPPPGEEALESILFLPRLRRIFGAWNAPSPPSSSTPETGPQAEGRHRLDLHVTSGAPASCSAEAVASDLAALSAAGAAAHPNIGPGVTVSNGRRFTQDDLREALGPWDARETAVVYVCGPAGMTDEVVAFLEVEEGMRGRVLCEKWW